MGNASSSNSVTQNQQELREAACAKSSSSSSSHLIATSVAAQNKANHTELRRSISLDGLSGRLNESFRRIYSSLSCTSLNTTGSHKRHSTDQSCSRPWSRVSRRRWHDSTLADDRLLSKTCWPVTHAEALFLPHFPIDSNAERQYSIVNHVANGAFGKVFRVRSITQSEEEKDFALKVFSKSEIINGNAIRQLKDEVDIQTICGHHPFLAKCVRYWQTKKKVFLLSHYYPNGELFQEFKKLPFELVRLYVAEIALALDFLHQAGIIYRDLKPENILLDQYYHVRLIDFGLSKWLSIGSRTRTLCGTLHYMAPEILNSEPYGHAVDWWALGVLACQMYTGEYPQLDMCKYLNKSDEVDKLIERAKVQKSIASSKLLPDSVNDLPADAQDLLKRLLEAKPQYRLRSLLQLQRIALYKNFNWDDVRQKKISPRQMIDAEALEPEADKSFDLFDW
ncbi:serine/threonine-protein kinase S6KL [Ochlerotatus camptorhynchus]|uniref:serine/threonine-protein kinase S6KL n=1 Tax=Ochlerotatus camptorhynchus TaxID=644619 RepID=UPI0031D6496F